MGRKKGEDVDRSKPAGSVSQGNWCEAPTGPGARGIPPSAAQPPKQQERPPGTPRLGGTGRQYLTITLVLQLLHVSPPDS